MPGTTCLQQKTTHPTQSKQLLSEWQPSHQNNSWECSTFCSFVFRNVLAEYLPDWPDPSRVIFSAALGRIKAGCCFKLDPVLHTVTNTEDHNLITYTAKLGQNKPYDIKMIISTNKLKVISSSGVQNINIKEIKKLTPTISMVTNTHIISTFPIHKDTHTHTHTHTHTQKT